MISTNLQFAVVRQRPQFRSRTVHVAILKDRYQRHHAVVNQILNARLHQVVVDVGKRRDPGHVIETVDVRGNLLGGQVPLVGRQLLDENGHLVIENGRRIAANPANFQVRSYRSYG